MNIEDVPGDRTPAEHLARKYHEAGIEVSGGKTLDELSTKKRKRAIAAMQKLIDDGVIKLLTPDPDEAEREMLRRGSWVDPESMGKALQEAQDKMEAADRAARGLPDTDEPNDKES